MSSRQLRFRVALSYAGENRDLILPIAEKLAELYGKERVLYDGFHAYDFARFRLNLRLNELFGKQSLLEWH